MKLSTGKVGFPLEFDNGDKDCIYFNPNDPDLATRLLATKDRISAKIESMKFDDFELSTSGEVAKIDSASDFMSLDDEQAKALMEKAEKSAQVLESLKNVVCEELNFAFGNDVSSVVFKHCSPFAIVEGNYFVVNFIEAITPEVTKQIQATNQTLSKNIDKHIRKYKK